MTSFNDKEVQLDMAFHNAIMAVMECEKWLPGADTHIDICKIVNQLRLMEDRAREKHFPKDGISKYVQAQAKTLNFIKKEILGDKE